jgi:DivIVA domain-containing protein
VVRSPLLVVLLLDSCSNDHNPADHAGGNDLSGRRTWTLMALTPDEIRSREFHLADRGYDRAEVRAFLAAVANQVDADPGTPWPAAEERLLLILDAAQRAVDTVREEASRALRDRLAAALEDVESALGAIDPAAQRAEPSTTPNS